MSSWRGRPDQLRLTDITYVRTREAAHMRPLVLDAYSQRIVGWELTDHLRTDLPLDASEMALRQLARDRPDGTPGPTTLIHHSNRWVAWRDDPSGARVRGAGCRSGSRL
ncbi:hypothetical protein GCM10010439_51560 [Actinocorallia aurantiaca]|uniref:Integrase catalytic domain-containing protein n=1 Tax=Actinocorallia aurantiaca TaxID=46204 RepID=A0ABN3UHD8_9ACTN